MNIQSQSMEDIVQVLHVSWLNSIPVPLAISMAIAGLGLFLFSIKVMSGSLKNMTSGYTLRLLKKFGSNPLLGLLFGFVFTAIIQSSDGAIALAIGLLGAGMMNLKGAIAFLLGANIGTSTTSMIVWLSNAASFTDYFMIFAFVGIMVIMLVKEEKISNIGTLIASFGMIFIGLKLLGWGMGRLGYTESFQTMFKTIAINPWSGLFASIGLTGLMQSSSASITVIQHMYEAQATDLGVGANALEFLPSAIAMILGANIGTTFTAFVISIGGNKDARRIGFIWFITNSICALLFMCIIYPWNGYGSFIVLMVPHDYTGQLALSHLFFNLTLSCSFIWVVKQLEWVAYKIIPRSNEKFLYKTNLSSELVYASPTIAFNSAREVTRQLAFMTRDSLGLMNDYLKTKDKSQYRKLKELLELIDITRKNLYVYLVDISSKNLPKSISNRRQSLVMALRSLEKIPLLGLEVFRDLNVTFNKKKNIFEIPETEFMEIQGMVSIVHSMTKRLPSMITRFNKVKKKEIIDLNKKANAAYEAFSKNHVEGNRKSNLEFDFLGALKILQRMANHGNNVIKYIENGRKENKMISLPDKLRKEILKDFK